MLKITGNNENSHTAKLEKTTDKDALLAEKAKKTWLLVNIFRQYEIDTSTHALVERFMPLTASKLIRNLSEVREIGEYKLNVLKGLLEQNTVDSANTRQLTVINNNLTKYYFKNPMITASVNEGGSLERLEKLAKSEYPKALEGYADFQEQFYISQSTQLARVDNTSLGIALQIAEEVFTDKAQLMRFKTILTSLSDENSPEHPK